jgi:hypothetical protein
LARAPRLSLGRKEGEHQDRSNFPALHVLQGRQLRVRIPRRRKACRAVSAPKIPSTRACVASPRLRPSLGRPRALGPGPPGRRGVGPGRGDQGLYIEQRGGSCRPPACPRDTGSPEVAHTPPVPCGSLRSPESLVSAGLARWGRALCPPGAWKCGTGVVWKFPRGKCRSPSPRGQ